MFLLEMNPKSSSKSPSRSGKPGSDFSSQRAVVPPVLREVGKLAAGVASVSTNSGGSATGNFVIGVVGGRLSAEIVLGIFLLG